MSQPQKKNERERRFFRAMVRHVSAPMLVISILWLSTVIWPPNVTAHWPFVSALQASAFCAAITAVFAVGLFRSALRAFLFALIAVVLVAAVPRIPALFVSDATVDSVRVLALNTYLGQADDHAIAERVKELKPDVLILSETNPDEVEQVASETTMVPTTTAEPGKGGADAVVILLRQGSDFGAHQDLGLTRFQNPMVTRPVLTPGGKSLHVVGTHLVAPIGNDRPEWDQELKSIAEWTDGKKATGASGVIVAGDFNATRSHPRFRDINLKDCTGHMAHTPTWPTVMPVLRLDHIMTTGTCHGAGTVRVAGTDHRGVWADITA